MKLDLYAGLLGVGKTTLIKQLLNTAYVGSKVAIIENEIGAVNLDASEFASISVKEITSGCVCCTVKGSFTEAIRLIEKQENPDYIIVEPTGASDLQGLVNACLEVPTVVLNRCVLVVNAKKIVRFLKAVGEFFMDQIRVAEMIYLNFADQMEPEAVEEAKQKLLEINPNLQMIETPMKEVGKDTFPENSCTLTAAGNKRRKDKLVIKEAKDQKRMMMTGGKQKQIYTWDYVFDGAFDEEQLEKLMTILEDTVYNDIWRAKGYFPMTDGSVRKVDVVFGDSFQDERDASEDITTGTLVLIGERLDTKWLQSQFENIEGKVL